MKTSLLSFLALASLLFILTIASCKKDEVPSTALSTATLVGDWKVTSSEGTEWKKDNVSSSPYIVTPRASDPGTVGVVLSFTTTQVTAKFGGQTFGPFSYTLDTANSTILMGDNGNTGIGFFSIKDFVAGKSMSMDQRIPLDVDYESNGSGSYLSFQKFFKLTKQ